MSGEYRIPFPFVKVDLVNPETLLVAADTNLKPTHIAHTSLLKSETNLCDDKQT